MPTKRMFDLAVLVVLFGKLAYAPVKLWAHRTNAEPGDGPATRLAQTVVVAG